MTTDTAYRFYDASGTLLYVGLTDHLPTRFRQHSQTQPWWALVDLVRVEHFNTRAEAEDAELRAIRTENPLHNIRNHPIRTRAVWKVDPLQWRPRDEDTLNTKEAAAFAGLSIEAWRKAVQRSESLREHRVPVDGRTPAYPRHIVEEWVRTRPGRGNRTNRATTEETS